MGNSCNSKSNRNIGGLAVDSHAPDGSWQNADGVKVAANPADPKEHRPVGDINEYRCAYYARHAHARLAHMQKGTGVAARDFPFEKLEGAVPAFASD